MMDMETRDAIRAMERRIKDMERQLGKVATRESIGTGGGTGFEIYTADVYANLPEVDGPAFGFTTGNQQMYVRRRYIGELGETWCIAAGLFTTDARPVSIGERQGDLWWGRGEGTTEEEKYDGILFVYDTRQEEDWRPCSVLALPTYTHTYDDAPIGTHAYGLSSDDVLYAMCNADGGKKWFPYTHLVEPVG